MVGQLSQNETSTLQHFSRSSKGYNKFFFQLLIIAPSTVSNFPKNGPKARLSPPLHTDTLLSHLIFHHLRFGTLNVKIWSRPPLICIRISHSTLGTQYLQHIHADICSSSRKAFLPTQNSLLM